MKRRVVVGVSTVGLVAAGVAVYGVSERAPVTQAQTRADPGQVNTLALRSEPARKREMTLPAGRTKPFSMLGVSWDDPRADLHGKVRVRARSVKGVWSPWQPVEVAGEDAPDGRAERSRRGSTAPLWVGPSNGVEIRVVGRRDLPRGMRAELIDPGNGRHTTGPRAAGRRAGGMTPVAAVETAPPTQAPDPTESASPSPSPTGTTGTTSTPTAKAQVGAASAGTAPRPAIVSRAQWGADETLVKEAPEYAPEVKVVFAHHTAGSNSYTCAESPSIIRSLMIYHVRTNGWNDVGYNFLVDKCGTIFEGRKGGADRPVVGAQTYGFNTGSSGVAVLGDHTSTAPAAAAVSATAKVAAWKLGLHGADPTGKAVLTTPIANGKFPAGTSVTFNTIAGHRDGYPTECPGTLLYNQLGTIRSQAKDWTTPATDPTVTSMAGATKVGATYYTKGTVTLGWKPSAATGYEVLVDGASAAKVDGSATSAKVTLAAGAHKLVLKAANADGSTVSSPEYAVTADPTAPKFDSPATLAMRTGTTSATGWIPTRLTWGKATDNTVLSAVKSTSPAAKTFATSATSWDYLARPNATSVWTMAATDAAGNTGTSSTTRATGLMHEYNSVRTGTWKTTSSSSLIGGRAYYASARGASASYTFTGRAAGIIVRKASNAGALYIYVDGVKTKWLDTRASATTYRQLVWTKSWSTSGKHTIKIVVSGTSGRPYVVTDGLAYLK